MREAIGDNVVCKICDKDLSVDTLCSSCASLRERVQLASKRVGHCVCTFPVAQGGFKCPCELFSKFNICHCAKEDKRLGDALPEEFVWPN